MYYAKKFKEYSKKSKENVAIKLTYLQITVVIRNHIIEHVNVNDISYFNP